MQLDEFVVKGQETKVCQLIRFIYGLKQALSSWNQRLNQAIKVFGFKQNVNEPSVYKRIKEDNMLFLV